MGEIGRFDPLTKFIFFHKTIAYSNIVYLTKLMKLMDNIVEIKFEFA